MLGATLTLPGIAGFILTVGIAVDANVIIFERIKEEVRSGMPPLSAIESGYDRAFISFISNVFSGAYNLDIIPLTYGPFSARLFIELM